MITLSSLKYRFRGLTEERRNALLEAYDRKTPPGTRAGFDIYLKEYSWWIHEGDLRLPGDTVNDINLIVTGDLIVDGWYDDDDRGGLLAVFGDMYGRHVFSSHTLYVGGDSRTHGLNLQFFNDWIFECGGLVAARAYICLDKAAGFDKAGADIEGFHHDRDYGGRSSLRPFELLGMLPAAGTTDTDEAEPNEDGEDEESDDDDDWSPDARDIVRRIKNAEAEGRSAFAIAEPAPTTAWREALHAETPPRRLAELAGTHGWELAMRPRLPLDLQHGLAGHGDPRVRWALAASPDVEQAILHRLADDPSPSVRAAVAGHERCPQDKWPRFAADADAAVRAAVIHAHGQGPEAWVLTLAHDADPAVRRAVAVIPNLPHRIVAVLAADPDTAVKNRAIRTQTQSLDALRAQFDSPDEGVRLQLAQAARYGSPPFTQDASGLGLCEEALGRFMLDPSARVREAAAVGFLAPTFYEAHAERLATDEVACIRGMLAFKTRQAEWLARLAGDGDIDVRTAVARNPHSPADVLHALTEDALGARPGFADVHTLGRALLENPSLPPDAVTRLFLARSPGDPSVEPHPRAPIEAFVQLVCSDPYCERGDPEYRIYRHCLACFADGRQPTANERDELFHRIVAAQCSPLTDHALGNAACPPGLLAGYIDRYLQGKTDVDAIQVVAANPSLPDEAMRRLAAHLMHERDWEVQQGLFRNPSCPADILTALATEASDAECRRDAREALWVWHGSAGTKGDDAG